MGKILEAYIFESIIGLFAYNKENSLIDYELFPKDFIKIAEILEKIQNGQMIDNLDRLVEKIKGKGYNRIILENELLAESIRKKHKLRVKFVKSSLAGKTFRQKLVKVALELMYVNDEKEFRELNHNITMLLAEKKVRESGGLDQELIKAVATINDITRSINLFHNRILDIYDDQFPELKDVINRPEIYLKMVINLGIRSNFTQKNIQRLGITSRKAKKISDLAKVSIGSELGIESLEIIKSLAKVSLQLYNLKSTLKKYLDELMLEVAPNIRALIGSNLGAQLISFSGGLTNLAKKTSSTIQVLGAEKALFRSIRTKSKPPKHGLIFQFPDVHKSSPRIRGKIARVLANKIMIASRIDAYKGKYQGNLLKKALTTRINEIKSSSIKNYIKQVT
jgi:nucleolar protein 56